MKTLLTLTLALISLSTFAAPDPDIALCEHFETETFSKLYGDIFYKPTQKHLKLIDKVSEKIEEKRKLDCKAGDLVVIKDYDTCSRLCVEHGSSDLRVKAMFKTGGLVDLNQETRDCQRLCRIYQRLAFTYRDGLKKGNATTDCSEGVSTVDRNNVKDVSSSGEKDLKKSSATKQ